MLTTDGIEEREGSARRTTPWHPMGRGDRPRIPRTSRGHRHHGGPWSTATAKETPIANERVAVRRRVERKLLSIENKPAKVAMDRMNPTP